MNTGAMLTFLGSQTALVSGNQQVCDVGATLGPRPTGALNGAPVTTSAAGGSAATGAGPTTAASGLAATAASGTGAGPTKSSAACKRHLNVKEAVGLAAMLGVLFLSRC